MGPIFQAINNNNSNKNNTNQKYAQSQMNTWYPDSYAGHFSQAIFFVLVIVLFWI